MCRSVSRVSDVQSLQKVLRHILYCTLSLVLVFSLEYCQLFGSLRARAQYCILSARCVLYITVFVCSRRHFNISREVTLREG